MGDDPRLAGVHAARERIRRHVHKTPVLTSSAIDDALGGSLFFKCENLQKVGAFKARGACNAVLSLPGPSLERGVVTHSSGNHAAALSWAARLRGIPAHIVMPENASPFKVRAVRSYGGRITFCKPTVEDRSATCERLRAETGATLVHPYDDRRIIEGQGTCALEFLEQVPDIDLLLAPIGGGGLLSGTLLAAKGTVPTVRVVGCEPALADDAFRGWKTGQIAPVLRTDTIADGLRTNLGDLTFPIIQRWIDDIALASEEWIIEATRLVWERMKLVIEPSSAVPLAAILAGQVDVRGRRVGLIVSGGNVELSKLPFADRGP